MAHAGLLVWSPSSQWPCQSRESPQSLGFSGAGDWRPGLEHRPFRDRMDKFANFSPF
ncbi:hypothetical protein FH063_005169 [Azospirillum argentinense]|uniref:Uncharacterized protein n=1 Tax=Azospirillum argentinense TaxID=2970906 RepID=A0A5B0KVD2_9PROT|nr:hypothetical protein FH063_005169 [Azospirillum argentinense]